MAWLIMAGIIALPVAEIMVWIKVADAIGALATIGLTVAAVMVGSAILRRQGLAMLLDARARMELGEAPVAAAFDGLCLAAAAGLGEGGAVVFATLCASASYIAAPAAVRAALKPALPPPRQMRS